MDDDRSLADDSGVGKGQFDPLAKKKKVGNYLLGKIIGEGSFSKVRQGIHIIAREKLAVKIVPKKAVLLRDYVKRGVRREVVLLQKLDHPNIVRLYEIMETENSYYLVLELAESGDFIKYLSENYEHREIDKLIGLGAERLVNRMSEERSYGDGLVRIDYRRIAKWLFSDSRKFLEEFECQKYIRQMASAVDHMHISNITHRDLKLENLLLDRDYNLKIIDFGHSNVFFGDTSLSTQCGSPVYAAPEIFCNKKYGPAVDVWSMGICMYAMLTGKLPFMPDPPSNLTLLHALILRGAFIPDHLSEGCRNVLSRMLKVEVHQRIRIDDILRHRWVLENHDTPLVTRQPPIGKLYPHIPKVPVVNYMTNVFTFLEDDIFYSVMERKMNAVAATYHLLQKRFDAGQLLAGGYTINTNSFNMTAHSSYTRGTTNQSLGGRGLELPQLTHENTFMSEAGTKGTTNTYKSYIKLLKDSKNRSAHVPRTNQFRQKELTLRRYRNRTEIAKHTRTKEENAGFLPDFILSYTKNEQINSSQKPEKGKQEGGFEWEQSFIFNKPKRNPHKPEVIENIKYGRLNKEREDQRLLLGDDGRGAVLVGESVGIPEEAMTMIELKAPPTTPATLFVDNNVLNRQHTRVQDRNSSDVETESDAGNDGKSGFEDPCNDNSWSSFHRQKTRLSRGVTMISKKSGTTGNIQYRIPITQPKALTPRDSKAYVEDTEHFGAPGQGRKYLDRSKTMTANLEDLHSIWTRKSRTASSQRSSINQDQSVISYNRDNDSQDTGIRIRTVDSNGILQLPQIISQPPPVLEMRPPSPPLVRKKTITDGVTDVIRISITGSAKH